MKRELGLFILLLVSGCTGMTYEQAGKSSRQTEQDIVICEDKLLSEHQNWSQLTEKEREALMDDCMKQQGYQIKQRTPK